MQLLAWKLFLLSMVLAIAAALPPALAKSPSDDELDAINSRAVELYNAGKYNEAIPLEQRYEAAMAARYGENAPEHATALNNLAQLLQATNRLAEAEPLMRRALAIGEKSFGAGHPDVARDLNNLAELLQATNRLAEAEPLMRRALAIDEKSFGPGHPNVAIRLDNLAQMFQETDRLAEAVPLMRRALTIDEESFGPGHPNVATRLNNLARLLQDAGRYAEAEPLMQRALAIYEKSFGPGHPHVGLELNNLATLLLFMNRPAEAEPLMRRALAIDEESFGPGHPNVADRLNNLAVLLEDLGRWSEAIALRKRAKPVMTGAHPGSEPGRGDLEKALLAQNTGGLRAYARALYRVDASDAANRAEGFELAQWALQSDAADALSAMAARFAKGGEELGKLVREQQDLLASREAAYRSLDAAAGKADAKGAEVARAAIKDIEVRLAENQAALRNAEPGYAELANPKPLALADAQALLGDGDALVLFLDLPQYGREAEETIIFALTKTEARWTSIGLGSAALQERVAALRCGLDTGSWREAGRQKCRELAGAEPSFDASGEAIAETLPFDLARAGALYRDLFGGIENLIAGKRLLIVPSGALTQLPLEALVTGKPNETLPRFEGYKTAAWLGQRQAITILPSVGSLKALRTAKASAAPEPFAGFGNPLLTGRDGADRSAWAKQDCGKAAPPKQTHIASLAASIASLFRGGAVNVEKLRQNSAASRDGGRALHRGPRARRSRAGAGQGYQSRRARDRNPGQDAVAKRRVGPRPRGAFRNPRPARGRNRAVRQKQGRALAAAHPARRGQRRRQRPAHRVGGGAAQPQRRLGGHVRLQHRRRIERRRGSAIGTRPRVLLRRCPLAARLALVRGFRSRRRDHHGRGERHEGEPRYRPRRGAPRRGSRAHCQGRALRTSERLGALRAGGQWGAVSTPAR